MCPWEDHSQCFQPGIKLIGGFSKFQLYIYSPVNYLDPEFPLKVGYVLGLSMFI